ncbi:helix-turn-helix domain-containing protein [Amaricoccus macauensis]|uniref:helix-turn-helix domain-containing protein n=1 Tax=Amaricoccus macauensis TaxID=57001 RepID=UPI003C7AE9F5
MQALIFETLKSVLRARGITYAELARRLGTSEPTIKRIFAARDDKLSRIIEICAALDVSLDDIIAQASRTEVRPVELGDRLEMRLAEDPSAFHLFLLLRDGMPAAEIGRQFGLDARTLFRIGRRLEDMGLAEVLEGGRIRILLEAPIRFRLDGPLHAALLRLNLEFIREVFLAGEGEDAGFLTRSRRISAHTARHVMESLRALTRELSEMARQDQLTLPAAELHSYKLCLAWGPVDFARLAPITEEAGRGMASHR